MPVVVVVDLEHLHQTMVLLLPVVVMEQLFQILVMQVLQISVVEVVEEQQVLLLTQQMEDLEDLVW
jgi:hypothetical protein